jgi:hypothetical protein
MRKNFSQTNSNVLLTSMTADITIIKVLKFYAVRFPLPTAAARDRFQVRSYRICDGQNGTGTGSSEYLYFLLPTFIRPIAPYTLIVL